MGPFINEKLLLEIAGQRAAGTPGRGRGVSSIKSSQVKFLLPTKTKNSPSLVFGAGSSRRKQEATSPTPRADYTYPLYP